MKKIVQVEEKMKITIIIVKIRIINKYIVKHNLPQVLHTFKVQKETL